MKHYSYTSSHQTLGHCVSQPANVWIPCLGISREICFKCRFLEAVASSWLGGSRRGLGERCRFRGASWAAPVQLRRKNLWGQSCSVAPGSERHVWHPQPARIFPLLADFLFLVCCYYRFKNFFFFWNIITSSVYVLMSTGLDLALGIRPRFGLGKRSFH